MKSRRFANKPIQSPSASFFGSAFQKNGRSGGNSRNTNNNSQRRIATCRLMVSLLLLLLLWFLFIFTFTSHSTKNAASFEALVQSVIAEDDSKATNKGANLNASDSKSIINNSTSIRNTTQTDQKSNSPSEAAAIYKDGASNTGADVDANVEVEVEVGAQRSVEAGLRTPNKKISTNDDNKNIANTNNELPIIKETQKYVEMDKNKTENLASIEQVHIASDNITQINIQTTRNKPSSTFAYAFLVAGVKPEKPTFKGYFLNIAIGNEILKRHHSNADVVCLIRMHVDTNYTSLPPEDERILTAGGVIIKYIPRPLTDNFHTAMMDKFRILQLTEYQRVIYLDADVLPLNNLDYIFHQSVGPNATLQENTVLTYHSEPCNGGFFMLKPNEEDYDVITRIIERREMQGYDFNETIGWGHVMTPPDQWESLNENGTKWDFYGSFTDQGLLYYWTKYVKKKVTFLFGDKVRTYSENKESGIVEMMREEAAKDFFAKAPGIGIVKPKHRDMYLSNYIAPYMHFHHFVQRRKPWLNEELARNPIEHVDNPRNENELWFNTLRDINTKYNLGINTTNIWVGRPTLGTFPARSMVKWAKESREKLSGQNHTEQQLRLLQQIDSSSTFNTTNKTNLTAMKDKNNSMSISSKSPSMLIQAGDSNSTSIPVPSSSTPLVSKQPNSRFAYAFLIAGCDPVKPSYKGYIYNVVVAKEILKSRGSVADIVVFIRMHGLASYRYHRLPESDEALLKKSGVIINYLPRPLADNFHTAMMDKFRILELTDYDRVIYLDADVMPLNNLDYFFEHSVGPDAALQENAVLANHLEPASGGFFMLKPDKEDYELITEIIEKRQRQGSDFNETFGWGHVITPPDNWQSFTESGTKWNFYGSFTDQGLLYYWTKYVKRNVSIVNKINVETWLSNEKGEVEKIKEVSSKVIFKKELGKLGIINPVQRIAGISSILPYRDFQHFIQRTKPWLNKQVALKPLDYVDNPKTPLEVWFNTLRKVNDDLDLGINLKSIWHGNARLGNFPTKRMVKMAKEIREMAEKEENENLEEDYD